MTHPILYEINTRCWLNALAAKYQRPITLATVPDEEVAAWQSLGVTHVWLMGVWTSGPGARALALAEPNLRRAYAEAFPDWKEEDVVGSPYAISSYEVPKNLGGTAELEKFRNRLASRSIKLVLDFVPNHLGLDHPWVVERPQLFVKGNSPAPETFRPETSSSSLYLAHGKDPYFSAWTDTAQLDYRQPETRSAMLELLQSVARRCDGVRCDMAMLVLNGVFAKTWARFPASSPQPETEFWADAIRAVKQEFPDFLFLAEAYWGTEPQLKANGFDFTYDKTLYDKLVSHDAPGVERHLLDASQAGTLASGAHFLENHDEPRIASLLSGAEHRAAALVVLGLPGMRFLHDGELTGFVRRVPVQLGRHAAEPAQPGIETMYEQLLTVLATSAVGQGSYQLLTPQTAWADNPTAQNFVLIQWSKSKPDFDLAVVNLVPHRSQCYAPITLPDSSVENWELRDMLGEESFVRSGQELQRRGLYLDLPPHGAQLFRFRPQGV